MSSGSPVSATGSAFKNSYTCPLCLFKHDLSASKTQKQNTMSCEEVLSCKKARQDLAKEIRGASTAVGKDISEAQWPPPKLSCTPLI